MLDRRTLDYVQTLAAGSPSREICGVVADDGAVYMILNVASKRNEFLMQKTQYLRVLNQIKAAGQQVAALFHSHINGDTEPSAKDMEFFRRSEFPMLIVTSNDWRYLPRE